MFGSHYRSGTLEDLLHERGIEVGHEKVRLWWKRFGPMFAAEIRWKRVSGMRALRWRWHLDEACMKTDGIQHYLWWALDHEGEVLEAYASKQRDKEAVLNPPFRKAPPLSYAADEGQEELLSPSQRGLCSLKYLEDRAFRYFLTRTPGCCL